MRIHREGYRIILIASVIVAVLAILIEMLGLPVWADILLTLPLLVLYILVVRFFRDPVRVVQGDTETVIAPCDGKVVVIEEVEETEYFKDRRIQVSIFMSPLNVHVNRNPIEGTVNYFQYHPGKYLVAWHPKSSTENERTTTVIGHANGKEVLFRQIAGAVARRIRWYLKVGDRVGRGSEMGFIKFGSRVDILLPLGTQIDVELGQKVSGAITPIARL